MSGKTVTTEMINAAQTAHRRFIEDSSWISDEEMRGLLEAAICKLPDIPVIVRSSGNVFDDLHVNTCGNCKSFDNEDASGYGFCSTHNEERKCSQTCENHFHRNLWRLGGRKPEDPCSADRLNQITSSSKSSKAEKETS